MTDRKPRWAWSSVDDPHPHYPKCDNCEAFARWAIAEHDNGNEVGPLNWIVGYFACGRHVSAILTAADWVLDELHIYDLTTPPERS
ncbi:hypothetical protein QLQ78_gp57 [Gordonia phage Jojo24]|uniref:Uncharacterized protein n=1 Tax=Gordonia phage Jojo24 TaxID=2859476 RepID=A0AAE7SQD4_9CAUD|nr:hypothetical protein QLQ78_gp57 [Gordonia phage Jojo24]QXO13154.1 hypothetical protein SEA_JOJO24_57 [Gordonia phage Jojo24]